MLKSRILFQKCYYSLPLRSENHCDIAIIGGGIIGIATAKTLKERLPASKIILLEKEQTLSQHQTSHNSGIVHAGLYYKPQSLKAKLCLKGLNLIYKYCDDNKIPYKKYGKLIIATTKPEVLKLKELYMRAIENKVPGVEMLDNCRKIGEIQPNCNALEAIWSPQTGNVDWTKVSKAFSQDFLGVGGEIRLNFNVADLRQSDLLSYPLIVNTNSDFLYAKYAILCGGLHSEELLETTPDYKAMIVKVNFKVLEDKVAKLVKTNLYTVADINAPFLGTHFIKSLNDGVLLLLNAVPALKVEGYNENEVDLNYVKGVVSHPAFLKMLLNHFPKCWDQVAKTFFSDVRKREIFKYLSLISDKDILPGPTAAQIQMIDNKGNFVDDFLIDVFQGKGIGKHVINCRFLPSPGATSSLAIAGMIADNIEKCI